MTATALAVPKTPADFRRMWLPDGPLRRWSPVRTTETRIFYEDPKSPDLQGYVGPYVCEACEGACDGVYRAGGEQNGLYRWLCAGCKTRARVP